MKKIIAAFLAFLAIFISGCGKTEQDPFAEYRGESSTALFTRGERQLAKKNYDAAVKNFEALDGLYPFGPYAQQGQLDIIYAYYMNGDQASAITAADRYVRLYPRDPHVDYAYYMRGIVGFELGLTWLQRKIGTNPAMRDVGNLEQSFSAFATVADQYPNSQYAADSLLRMSYIRNLLASREVSVAKFYMARKAYVAAANRASTVVVHYQGTDQVANALAVMVKAYQKLHLPKMAQQTLGLLKMNFSSSLAYQRLAHRQKSVS